MRYDRLQVIIDRIKANHRCWDQSKSGWAHNDSWLTAYAIEGHAMRDADIDDLMCLDPFDAGMEWLEATKKEATWLFSSLREMDELEQFMDIKRLPNKDDWKALKKSREKYILMTTFTKRHRKEIDALIAPNDPHTDYEREMVVQRNEDWYQKAKKEGVRLV